MRAPSIFAGFEPFTAPLQREGRWFSPKLGWVFAGSSVSEMRSWLLARAKPVSGDIRRLRERVRYVSSKGNVDEIRLECVRLGLKKGSKRAMEEQLESIYGFEQLSLEDLQFECAYRNYPTSESREAMLTHLRHVYRK